MQTSRNKKTVLALTVALLFALIAGPAPSHAVEPGEMLKDHKLEARARELSLELRCLVCQNQSIDDSNAPLAHDLRVLVRERLKAGASDREVLDYIVARYGEFVLLRPRFGWHTALLWLAPLLALIGAIALARTVFRTRSAPVPPAALTAEERHRLSEILAADDQAQPRN
jgi:cytochrome c-type biogenesis protein CcmH